MPTLPTLPASFTRRLLIGALAAAPLAGLAPRRGHARAPAVFATHGIAINGTDPVAYFAENRPVPGAAGITADWMGATFRFASAANRDRFLSDPEAYAPRFGGWCAYAVAGNYVAPTLPEAFTIWQGRLYLNATLRVRATWERDIPGYVAKAEANWPGALGWGPRSAPCGGGIRR